MPATIASAATKAPSVVLPPRTNAIATPGSTPCASASPRKLIPRSTTHVPTSDVHTAVSSTAHSALRIASMSTNGSTHHAQGWVMKLTGAPSACEHVSLTIEGVGDRLGVDVEQHPDTW